MLDSDWSPLGGYQTNYTNSPASSLNPTFPQHQNHHKLAAAAAPDTPPLSVTSSANSTNPHADGQNMQRTNGNPSPPASVAARSSNGTVSTTMMDEKRYQALEQALSEHHRTLMRYLGPRLREIKSDPKQAKARDKLLRLSPGQFQELSTDVYDELTRRENERKRGGPELPGNPVPKYLLPRPTFHVKRNQARQKLSTLPIDRFQQLATDVFFELERRFPRFARSESSLDSITDRNSPSRNSPSRNSPSRNGGQYPTTGPAGMRSDSRAGLGLDNLGDDQKPLPRQYQSNVMVPNKGNMVEDDSDNEGTRSIPSGRTDSPAREYRDMVSKLEIKVDELVSQLQLKDKELEKAQVASLNFSNVEAERSEWDRSRNQLEDKLMQVQSLNESLQNELQKVRSNHDRLQDDFAAKSDVLERERKDHRDREISLQNLQSQFDSHRHNTQNKETELLAEIEKARTFTAARNVSDQDDWKARCESLQRELSDQRKITDEVRQDTARYLIEMRELSNQSHEAIETEEKLMAQVSQLEREVRTWKQRCAKLKSETGPVQSNGYAEANSQRNIAGMAQTHTGENGLIRDVHFSNYQLAVDDLLQQIRSGDSQYISESMKHVVMAVRAITSDVDAAAAQISEGERISVRTKLSQCANHLISATKAHGISNGLSPVTLVEGAILHLTNAVVEAVQAFKLRLSTPEELERDDMTLTHDTPMPAALMSDSSVTSPHHTRNASNSSAGFSNYSRYSRYSANTSPEQLSAEIKGGSGMGTPQILGMLRENSIEEFKNFLEDSTALLVRSIQPMVNTVRNGAMHANDRALVNDYVRDIDATVQDIVVKTNAALRDLKDPALNRHAPPVASALEGTAFDLKSVSDNGAYDRIPPLAFKIARVVKELVLRVDRIEIGELTADMTLPTSF